MKKVDSVYLKDILEAINKINQFIGDFTYAQFQNDERTQFAVFHALEVIGEASNKLSKDFVQSNPEFPVRQAVELRNFIIHGYDQIELSVVWKTIQDDLPQLKELTRKLLTKDISTEHIQR